MSVQFAPGTRTRLAHAPDRFMTHIAVQEADDEGEVYCLFEAPIAVAAEAVHREAHGNVADEIVEVKEGS